MRYLQHRVIHISMIYIGTYMQPTLHHRIIIDIKLTNFLKIQMREDLYLLQLVIRGFECYLKKKLQQNKRNILEYHIVHNFTLISRFSLKENKMHINEMLSSFFFSPETFLK